MPSPSFRRIVAASVVTLVPVVGGATAAYAAWQFGGSGGNGQIKAATLERPTVSVSGNACGNSGRNILVTLANDSIPTGMAGTTSVKVQLARATTTGGESFTSPLVTLAAGTASYTDSSIAASTTYFYEARLVFPTTAQWIGATSAEASAKC